LISSDETFARAQHVHRDIEVSSLVAAAGWLGRAGISVSSHGSSLLLRQLTVDWARDRFSLICDSIVIRVSQNFLKT
jgi:hypothetical protein